MKYILKRFWLLILIAFIVNVPTIIFLVLPTNEALTLTGDTTPINSFLEIDGAYIEEGSFSSIYVINYNHSTRFQNFIADLDIFQDHSEIYSGYTHLTNNEQYRAGQIQKKSSIDNALILAFTRAKKYREDIVFDYSFRSLAVSWYKAGSNFRIDDEIIGVNDIKITKDNPNDFIKAYNLIDKDTITSFNVIRDNEEIAITGTKTDYAFYQYYDIEYSKVVPSITIKSTNTGGPSAGFLQALSLYNRLIPEDLTKGKKIAGTGTIDINGNVGAIGGIRQKVLTAYQDNMEIFFCPKANEEEGLLAYNAIKGKEKMKFVVVETIDDAIKELENE